MYRKTLLASAVLSALAMPSYAQEVQDEQEYIEEMTSQFEWCSTKIGLLCSLKFFHAF